MQGEGILFPMDRNEHDRSGLRGVPHPVYPTGPRPPVSPAWAGPATRPFSRATV